MFGELIVCYLFLAGAGAGACLVLSAMTLLVPTEYAATMSRDGVGRAVFVSRPAFGRFFFPAFAVSFAALFLGVVCLLLDLGGRIDVLTVLVASPSLTYITVGAYALAAELVLAGFLALCWGGFLRGLRWGAVRAGAVVAIVGAAIVMTYAGLFLQGMNSVPLWTASTLPLLFVLSALSCGMAIVLAVAQFSGAARDFSSVLRRLALCDAICIVLEILVVVVMIASLLDQLGIDLREVRLILMGVLPVTDALPANATGTDLGLAHSLSALMVGAYANLFWGGFVLVGMVVPFVCDIVIARSRKLVSGFAVATAGCALVGGFLMRLCIVSAGVKPLLVVPFFS